MCVIHNRKLVKRKGVQAAKYSCKIFKMTMTEHCMNISFWLDTNVCLSLNVNIVLCPAKIESVYAA